MRAKGYNPNALSVAMGMTGGSRIHAWLKGEALPDGKNMMKLVEALGVDGHWLLMGEDGAKEQPPSQKEWAFDKLADIIDGVRSELGQLPTIPPESFEVLPRPSEEEKRKKRRA